MDNKGFLPSRIVAGESIWLSALNTAQDGQDLIFDTFAPSGGYTLSYKFAAAIPISVSATANTDTTGWTLEVTAAQSLLWTAGEIRFAGYVTNTVSTRVFCVDEGAIAVTANPMTVSQYAAALTACEAAIATYAANPMGSFNLGGMQVVYRSLSQLTDLRDYLKAQVALETGKRPKRIIRVRFT